MKYYKLKPIDKIHKNYLSWSENWTHQHSIKYGIYYRIDIWLLGFLRCLGILQINDSKLKMAVIDRKYDVITLFINKKYYK